MNLQIQEMNVYVPAKDFEESKRFYSELGFELSEAWGGNFDCRLGPALFRLQNYFVKDWANNFMLQFFVSDAKAWYEHIKKMVDSRNYKNIRVKEPETTDGVLITHAWDPCGVLLIFIQKL